MKQVTIELINGVVFQTKVNDSDWDRFFEWLESDETIEHYTVD